MPLTTDRYWVAQNDACGCWNPICFRVFCRECGSYLAIHCGSLEEAEVVAGAELATHPCAPHRMPAPKKSWEDG